ncbi:hypothetical protein AZO1586I_546 [Bathymodiolus thermophilus thioautotrophic gill symbiont]|uniref:Uncharacterized protein n=1 Tax=Bathymodiolus thermophilus thioautotrophic gill symbiont TaxID=2360 RepID=A0ABM8M670_9GAMM|nr:hypothetical protein [Bathymodiolus thermophilus thioautotrophic gill symbiont]CAB5499768.1 hypothetical protein AZO1586I_546 [Bathymodiolus thermophilus thioautotrophic gill symbiont]
MVLTKKQFHPLGENQRQIVATDFRSGNISPAKDNLGFIKICQDALQ